MNRDHIASMQKTPRDRARSATSRASAALVANGFSQSTGLPASRASIMCSRWTWSGEAT